MMERNERLTAANKCASRYSNKNEARIAKKAFMEGCEFEGQGEIIKGEVLSEPSLPSNLDEAAEKIAWDIAPNHPDISWDNCFEKIKKGIKAGAEWMAGQGVSYNTKVGWIDGPTVLDWPDDILDKFEMGDEVIVQIRKKQ